MIHVVFMMPILSGENELYTQNDDQAALTSTMPVCVLKGYFVGECVKQIHGSVSFVVQKRQACLLEFAKLCSFGSFWFVRCPGQEVSYNLMRFLYYDKQEALAKVV